MGMEASIYELLRNAGAAKKSSQRRSVMCLSLSSVTAVQRLCSLRTACTLCLHPSYGNMFSALFVTSHRD